MSSQITQEDMTKMTTDSSIKNYRSSLKALYSKRMPSMTKRVMRGLISILEKELQGRLNDGKALVELLEEYRKAGLITEDFVEQLEEYRKTK